MTSPKLNVLDALRALIAERQQYEQWLATLETKREGTPKQVFARVQADYQGRLARVMRDIAGHSDELQRSIDTLSAQLDETARDEDSRKEALAEAELRAAVGEFDAARWEETRSVASQELEEITARRDVLEAQLGEFRSIQRLSEATGPLPESALEEVRPAEPAAARDEEPVEPPVEPSSPPTLTLHTSAATSKPVETPPSRNERDSVTAGTGSQERGGSRSSTALGSSAGGARPNPAGDEAPAPRSTPARSAAARGEAHKTLKCPECGTPNYPTEWYCERCGGELATV